MSSSDPGRVKTKNLSPTLLNTPGVILIDDWNISSHTGCTYLFTSPITSIFCHHPEEIQKSFKTIAQYQAEGKHVAGYIAYDSGLKLDKVILSRHNPEVPLLCMFVYNNVQTLDHSRAQFSNWDGLGCLSEPRMNISEAHYIENVNKVKDYIGAGDVYQVNYTCKLLFENNGTASGLFARLREAHPVCHSAFINAGDFQIISLSPELFLRKSEDSVITRPMKGTSPRGHSCLDDKHQAAALHLSPKNRAENVMILDLMRNDIGRICEYGSVTASDIFKVERYRSLFQMTSQARGTLRNDATLSDILNATFPPGSITGAPKSRALEIIDELENDARGVYCGSIGMFRPGSDFVLNVAIRTILQRGNQCELGVGSGIVADSDPVRELQETMLKGNFLQLEPYGFQLLETLLYDSTSGFAYLDAHLERMRASADYFGYSFDPKTTRQALIQTTQGRNGLHRVRLLATKTGEITIQCTLLESIQSSPIRLLLSDRATDLSDIYLYHKTTNRAAYDSDLASARKQGFFDMLYKNIDSELTECAVTNICIKINGKWYTPPVNCGLLPGIWREELIQNHKVIEKILTLCDLRQAESVMIGNSVRGAIEVESIQDSGGTVLFSARN